MTIKYGTERFWRMLEQGWVVWGVSRGYAVLVRVNRVEGRKTA